jgi:hypothetical protein
MLCDKAYAAGAHNHAATLSATHWNAYAYVKVTKNLHMHPNEFNMHVNVLSIELLHGYVLPTSVLPYSM